MQEAETLIEKKQFSQALAKLDLLKSPRITDPKLEKKFHKVQEDCYVAIITDTLKRGAKDSKETAASLLGRMRQIPALRKRADALAKELELDREP